jgi:hypothetical protein
MGIHKIIKLYISPLDSDNYRPKQEISGRNMVYDENNKPGASTITMDREEVTNEN